jgi:hypothetical protein
VLEDMYVLRSAIDPDGHPFRSISADQEEQRTPSQFVFDINARLSCKLPLRRPCTDEHIQVFKTIESREATIEYYKI